MGNQATGSARLRVLVIIVVVFTALAGFLWLRSRRVGFGNDYIDFRDAERASGPVLENPSPALTSPTVSPVPTEPATPSPGVPLPSGSDVPSSPSPDNAQSTKDSILSGSFVGTLKLIIPVAGVRPEQLQDTFMDARSEGRVHDAIDIMAPVETPVVAASDGEIVRLFQSERGGTTIYQLSPDKKLVFYYAHLQRYADGLAAGKFARQGEVIGYVGDTGNAGAGNYHLHFSIAVLTDPKRYWEGKNINPYPLLRQ
ncbi:MAG: peptidoglycan DD-metalloendopeptidase family protein [Acidobacteriota bacterium]|nr:peptidoglycan DD-metalloendopeptidase family protein [Acidobacteriota bacterium]